MMLLELDLPLHARPGRRLQRSCRKKLFLASRKRKETPAIMAQHAVTDNAILASAARSRIGKNRFTDLQKFVTEKVDLEDLMRAECKLLGEGKYGTTFKATLENGVVFIVKRSKVENVAKTVFEERIEAIGAIEHELIVPLCGYYFSKDEQLLIYNYFGNGSLSSNLHGSRINKVEPAGWETRSAIALSSARAVAYIHSTNPKASHGNIKSSNILLTGSYEAHISEHGINTLVRTPASCITYNTAPEVKDMQNVSQKADVYSFGVLLLELLTGVSPCPTYSSEGHDLVAWDMAAPQEQRETRVLDQKLLKDNGMVEEMLQFLQLATQCCEKRPNLRPVMSEVVQKIEEIQSLIVGNRQPMWSSEEE
ncbi:hypothetical protein PR202_gb23212 [Eleusine coracana subsp. coracana]|uniref:Protein kinase domain-containing protein n=1 Tax=Eleusine coracana subsp. coracana TaxID=191504 RepID=A0AAV5FHN0_ELECO|nr:hypothetical protein PR202_gb23212 [Eleusine coracana subsp. coracana]